MLPVKPLLTLTVISAQTLTPNRFVTGSGTYPKLGGVALGVSRSQATQFAQAVPVDVYGVVCVETISRIPPDTPVMSDEEGRAIPFDGKPENHAIGRTLNSEFNSTNALTNVLLLPVAGSPLPNIPD